MFKEFGVNHLKNMIIPLVILNLIVNPQGVLIIWILLHLLPVIIVTEFIKGILLRDFGTIFTSSNLRLFKKAFKLGVRFIFIRGKIKDLHIKFFYL